MVRGRGDDHHPPFSSIPVQFLLPITVWLSGLVYDHAVQSFYAARPELGAAGVAALDPGSLDAAAERAASGLLVQGSSKNT